LTAGDWGIACLLPTTLVFALALWTRRPIESLLSGSLAGLLMLHGSGFVTAMAEPRSTCSQIPTSPG
jgi:Na+/H+ antiporter NhaC